MCKIYGKIILDNYLKYCAEEQEWMEKLRKAHKKQKIRPI